MAKLRMEFMKITRITTNEIDQLQKIGRQTFYETFSTGNTQENMQKYLDERFSIEKLTAELNDKNAIFYFAQLENKIVGYLKINFGDSQTELKDDKSLEIERIYVLKEFQEKKLKTTKSYFLNEIKIVFLQKFSYRHLNHLSES